MASCVFVSNGGTAPLIQSRDLCRAFVGTGSLERDILLGGDAHMSLGLPEEEVSVLQHHAKRGGGGECSRCCASG